MHLEFVDFDNHFGGPGTAIEHEAISLFDKASYWPFVQFEQKFIEVVNNFVNVLRFNFGNIRFKLWSCFILQTFDLGLEQMN